VVCTLTFTKQEGVVGATKNTQVTKSVKRGFVLTMLRQNLVGKPVSATGSLLTSFVARTRNDSSRQKSARTDEWPELFFCPARELL